MRKILVILIGLLCIVLSYPVQAKNVNIPTSELAQSVITTTAISLYFPILKSQMLPEAPVLNTISDPESDGSYAISWANAKYAERYTLQVATSDNFADTSTVYDGPDITYTMSDQRAGTYYYRVAANNSVGNSEWSNVQSVNVRPPSTFPSIADASVLQGNPDYNDGQDGDMWTGYEHCNGLKITRNLVKFDLSSIPTGTSIAHAQLYLYLYGSCDLADRSHEVVAYPVTSGWAEDTVTWRTQPKIDSAAGSTAVQSRSWGWYSLDVTALASNWISGALANNGLMLRGPEGSGNDSAMLAFLTRDASADYTPYLEITYANTAKATAIQNSTNRNLPTSIKQTKAIYNMAVDATDASFTWAQAVNLASTQNFAYRGDNALTQERGSAVAPFVQAKLKSLNNLSQQAVIAGKTGKLTPRLQMMAQLALSQSQLSTQAEADVLSVTEAGLGSLLKDQYRAPLVYIRLNDVSETTLSDLRAAGAKIVDVADHYKTITAFVDPASLTTVAGVGAVLSIEEEFAPLHKDNPAQVHSALQRTVTPNTPTVCPGGTVTSEGDTHLKAAEARERFGVDGTGVTVGVLSDSYNSAPAITSATQDIATGDLPGPGNPCGRLDAVRVISESNSINNIDEGRAMLQIIHDLAPGARLQFATANTGIFAFAKNIRALHAAGSNIIVDDVAYLAEPFYQDGPISVAASDVVNEGALYFTAAGNSNKIIDGNDVASYEASAFRSTSCPVAFPSILADSCHNFSSSATVDSDDTLTIGPGGGVIVLLQWAQPWYGVTTDLDLMLLDRAGNIVAAGTSSNKTTQRPVDVFGFGNYTGVPQQYRIVVTRYRGPNGGDDQTPRFKLIILASAKLQAVEYALSNGNDIVGPSVFGHSATANVISVAATTYTSTTGLEDFSSRGPATLYFGPVRNNVPASGLNPPQTLEKPDIAATNNVVTTFFGSQDNPGQYRFRGTSAAAPHAAAVAALIFQQGQKVAGYHPSLGSIESLLESSTQALIGAPTLGLIDAVAAIRALQTAVPMITTQPNSKTVIRGQSATLTVVANGLGPFNYQWYQGTSGDTISPVEGAVASSFTSSTLLHTANFWVRVTNIHGSIDSATATIDVITPVEIVQQPADQTIASGQNVTLTVVASGAAPFTYQWYQGRSGDISQPISQALFSTYSTPGLSKNTDFWVRVTDAGGASVDSNIAKVTVVTQLPITVPVTITADVAFSVTVTALDSANAPANGYRGTVQFTTSDNQASLPSRYTFVAADNGAHAFTVVLKTPGSQTLTVSDETVSGAGVNFYVETARYDVYLPVIEK